MTSSPVPLAADSDSRVAAAPAGRARRGCVRPVAEADLPAIARLYDRVFGAPPAGSREPIEQFVADIFCGQPWATHGLPSLAYEDADGEVRGAMGIVTRPMRFRGRPIQVATSHHFMVAPETRGSLASVALAREFLAGPQDISIAEGCSPSRDLWERLGGATAVVHSLGWIRPLRPCACGLFSLRRRGRRAAAGMLTPLGALVDAAVALAPGVLPHASRLTGSPLEIDDLLEASTKIDDELRPQYDAKMVAWLFDRLARKTHRGELRKTLVRDAGGAGIGWHVYYVVRGGISQVAHIAAVPGRWNDVVDHLCADAHAAGAGAVAGHLDRPMLGYQGGRPVLLHHADDSWILVHARDPELVLPLQSGSARLTRLDTDWWLNY